MESPSAVTHSTRPPLVTTLPASRDEPAWNTWKSSAGDGMQYRRDIGHRAVGRKP